MCGCPLLRGFLESPKFTEYRLQTCGVVVVPSLLDESKQDPQRHVSLQNFNVEAVFTAREHLNQQISHVQECKRTYR